MTAEQARQMRALLEAQTDQMDDEDILKYPDFVQKWEKDTLYQTGKRLAYDGVIYKVLQDHASQNEWTPDVSPSLFAKILIPDADTIPAWEQPESTNGYMTGDKVAHGSKTWVSTCDNNVWEPGVHGWMEVV